MDVIKYNIYTHTSHNTLIPWDSQHLMLMSSQHPGFLRSLNPRFAPARPPKCSAGCGDVWSLRSSEEDSFFQVIKLEASFARFVRRAANTEQLSKLSPRLQLWGGLFLNV